MKKISLVSLVALVALLATIGTAMAGSKTVFTARLSGEEVGSLAHGNAVFVLSDDGSQMNYKLVVNGLKDGIMAHIHVADAPGGVGPVVLWLYPDETPFEPTLTPGFFNGLLGSRTVTSADLTGAQGINSLDELRIAIEEGRAYVNVHTNAFKAGEARGFIH